MARDMGLWGGITESVKTMESVKGESVKHIKLTYQRTQLISETMSFSPPLFASLMFSCLALLSPCRTLLAAFLGPAVLALLFRPNGAKCDSLGQRPRKDQTAQTPKPQRGENNGIAPCCFAPSGLF